MGKKKAPSFPVPDDPFDGAFQGLVAHLSEPDPTSNDTVNPSWQRLGLDNVTVYTPLVKLLGSETTPNSWLYAFPLIKSKATYTKPLQMQKNALKRKALTIIRPARMILKEQEKANPGFLTENDKTVWFIPKPDPITPSHDAMLTKHPSPVVSIHEIKNNQHVIDVRDPDSPKSRSLPDGIILLHIARFIGAVPPADPLQYTHLLYSGKFRNLSTFTADNKKQTAWYVAQYISPTGEESNWSEPVCATVA
jgi:hypothetical protein